MTSATIYQYRRVIISPGVKLWELLRILIDSLFPRKVVVLGRLLLLVSLSIPPGMVIGVLPLSFGLLCLALLGVAAGSFACLIGPTFYIGGGQALY